MTLISLCGPTAAGKTSAAIAIAQATGGLIINADSRQVYRELPILSAQPGPDDKRRAPHALFANCSIADNYSVGAWYRDVSSLVNEFRQQCGARGRANPPIVIVGGTGLYFSALDAGLSPLPPVGEEVKLKLHEQLQNEGLAALYGELQDCDPITAKRLYSNDKQRIMHALAIFRASKRTLSDCYRQRVRLVEDSNWHRFILAPDVVDLRRSAERRFGEMINAGAVAEVEEYRKLAAAPAHPTQTTLGVRDLAGYLDGNCSLPQAIDCAVLHTNRYIKRQFTWLRNQLTGYEWHASASSVSERALELMHDSGDKSAS